MNKQISLISLLATALACAACCFVGPEPAASDRMYIDRELSQVWRQPSGGSESEITRTVEGHSGDAVWARKKGQALLRWPDLYIRLKTDASMDSGMELLDATPTWLHLGLVVGAAHISAAPALSQRVEFTTGNSRVLLTGTSLMLEYHPATRNTVLRVFRGQVETNNLADPAAVKTVRAGQGAVIEKDAPPRIFNHLEDMRPLARELGLWDLFHQIELDEQAGFGPSGTTPTQIQIVFAEQPTSTPGRAATPTRKPAPAPIRIPKHTATPTVSVPDIQLRYWADQECLLDMDCTTLHWEVDNAQAVTLNGEGVGGYDSRLACPPGQTGEYTLRAVRGVQSVERTIVLRRVTAELSVDHEQIQQGECTTVRWDVAGAREVYLNGDEVAGRDYRQVCPGTTTRYALHVMSDCGNIDRAVTIQVTPAPVVDPYGPDIGSIDTQPPGDTLCERSRIDVSTRITDDQSGVRNAELWVLFIPYNGVGAWTSIPMDRSGNTFSASITGLSLGEVTIYVRAWDNAGNSSETDKRRIVITLC